MLNCYLLTQTVLLMKLLRVWEFFKWKVLFDFSNYLKDSTIFDETNKKVIGKMKEEFGGVIVVEFVGCILWKKLMVKNVIQQKRWLSFIKIVSQVVKRLKNIVIKKIVIIEKDRDNWKRSWQLKKIMIIKKDYDDRKRLQWLKNSCL